MNKSSPSQQFSLFDLEVWLPVSGFEDRYEVSNFGRVKATYYSPNRGQKPGRILKSVPNCKTGHHKVKLCSASGLRKQSLVHRVVLEAFIGPCPKGKETLHDDGNPANNRLSNLSWGTSKENAADRIRHGTVLQGEQSTNVKLTAEKVGAIRQRYRSGESQETLARAFGVARPTIKDAVKYKTWKTVE